MNDNTKSLLKLAIAIVFALGVVYFLVRSSKDKVIIYEDDGTYERIK